MKNLFANYHILVVSTFLSMIVPGTLQSQNDPVKATYYNSFDNIIGKNNTGVFKGIQYFEKFQVKNDNHKFFKYKFFIWGAVVYNNQPYFEIALKYDVYGDELLIKNSKILDAPIIQLKKKNVTGFELNGHIFKNVTFNIDQDKEVNGFFEILLENNPVSIFKKYQKKISKIVEKEVYYEFKDQFQYYIRYNDTYYLLKKISFLTTIFAEYKTQLKNSFKRHESLRKIDSDEYLKSIIVDLNTLILNSK